MVSRYAWDAAQTPAPSNCRDRAHPASSSVSQPHFTDVETEAHPGPPTRRCLRAPGPSLPPGPVRPPLPTQPRPRLVGTGSGGREGVEQLLATGPPSTLCPACAVGTAVLGAVRGKAWIWGRKGGVGNLSGDSNSRWNCEQRRGISTGWAARGPAGGGGTARDTPLGPRRLGRDEKRPAARGGRQGHRSGSY